jgi:ketosteroid isomerase-like protein
MTFSSARVLALALFGLVGCAGPSLSESGETPNIIEGSFPEAESAVRAAILSIDEHVGRKDFDGLSGDHLDSPKFSKFGPRVLERQGFADMIADEIKAVSAAQDLSIEFRDLKIDVFGDVAIATSYPLFTYKGPDGEPAAHEARMTLVWVKTPDGWKIVHEHSSPNTM